MNKPSGFIAIFRRECIRIATSKIYIWGVVFALLISAVIMLFLMNEGLPMKMPIAVVDLDNTPTSRGLVRQLDAFPKTNVLYKDLSFKEARKKMEEMDIFAILYIPRDFTKDAQAGNRPKLVYYTNNAFMVSGSLLFQDLKTISTLASASVGLQMATAKGATSRQAISVASPIPVDTHPIHNPWLNYSILLNSIVLPCLMQLSVFMFTASSFGSEIKAGNGKELMKLADHSSWNLVVGKILPNTIVFLVIGLLYMSLLYYYNAFPLHNGFLPMFFNYTLFIVASQAVGLVFLVVFRTYRMAVSVAALLGILAFSLVGFSFPTPSMYGMFDALAHIYPAKYFHYIYGDQALNEVPLSLSLNYYLALLGFVLLGLIMIRPVRKIVEYDEYKI